MEQKEPTENKTEVQIAARYKDDFAERFITQAKRFGMSNNELARKFIAEGLLKAEQEATQ